MDRTSSQRIEMLPSPCKYDGEKFINGYSVNLELRTLVFTYNGFRSIKSVVYIMCSEFFLTIQIGCLRN